MPDRMGSRVGVVRGVEMVRRAPAVPLKFSQLPWGYGIEFKCQACSRAAGFDKGDLLMKWGDEGRVADVAAKFVCSNCKAKNPRRRPNVRVRVFQTETMTVTALNRSPIDKLVAQIKELRPKGKITGNLRARGDSVEPPLPNNVVMMSRDHSDDE